MLFLCKPWQHNFKKTELYYQVQILPFPAYANIKVKL